MIRHVPRPTYQAPRRYGRSDSRGTLLILTLSVVVLLSLLSVAVARHLMLEVRLTRYQLAQEQAKIMARDGIYLAMEKLLQDAQDDAESYDWLGDDWAIPGKDELQDDPTEWIVELSQDQYNDLRWDLGVHIHITDEGSRLDLNTATSEQIESLIGSVPVAQAIVDHIDPDQEDQRIIEDPPYRPKDAPIARIEELFSIPEVTQDYRPPLVNFARAATSESPIALNINTAESDVLIAVAGEPMRSVIEQLTANRSGLDGIFGTIDDCIATEKSSAATELAECAFAGDSEAITSLLSKLDYAVSSSLFRLESQGQVVSPKVSYRIEAIVSRSTEQTKILAWKEG